MLAGRFGALPTGTAERLERIDSASSLHGLALSVQRVASLDEFLALLAEAEGQAN